ncbi:MAG TPA: hypothetical protein VF097_02340 [Actinomycetota bacterium]
MMRNRVPALALLVALVAAGCGGGEETVEVTLQEFAVLPAQDTVSAGSVTFDATNEGPDDPHELVVIQTDLAPEELPTTDEGGVDEEGEGIEVIGEIEEFPVGETESATFDLDAGDYVLICNIVEEEDGELEAHYELGMRVGFTVE